VASFRSAGSAVPGIDLEQAMDGLGLAAGALAEALRCSSGRRRQSNLNLTANRMSRGLGRIQRAIIARFDDGSHPGPEVRRWVGAPELIALIYGETSRRAAITAGATYLHHYVLHR